VPGKTPRRIDRIRLRDLRAQVWPPLLRRCGGTLAGKRVLDVACNCGGFSIEAAKSGAASVLGVDVVDRYLEQADLVKRALEVDSVEFRKLAVEELDSGTVGTFDVAFCFGLLYHLENPILGMKRLAAVTGDILVVETKLEPRWPGEEVWTMEFVHADDADSRIASTALWRTGTHAQFAPTARAVDSLLRFLGFSRVELLPPHPGMWKPFHDGLRGTFVATRA
jgi:tRNA (mo5U34)-methyltransferase